jgi:hypothetical protein
MKFPYTRLPDKIKRPIIRIAVEHKGKEIPYFGLTILGRCRSLSGVMIVSTRAVLPGSLGSSEPCLSPGAQ